MKNKIPSFLIKGLIISLVLFIMDMASGFGDYKFAAWYRWIPSIVLLVALIWVCISYGSEHNGEISFGNVFSHGFKTGIVIAALSVVFALLTFYLIAPETKEQFLDQARRTMESKGDRTDDQIEQAMDFTTKFFIPIAIVSMVVSTLIIAVIASLIGAAVTKKNATADFENQ